MTFNNFLVFTAAGTVAFTGQNLTFNTSLAAPVALPAAPHLLPTNTTTFTGVFSAAAGVTLTLSGVPLVSETTTISPSASGSLLLTGPTSVAQALTVIISGGTLTLTGTGTLVTTLASAVTLNQGGGLTLDNSSTATDSFDHQPEHAPGDDHHAGVQRRHLDLQRQQRRRQHHAADPGQRHLQQRQLDHRLQPGDRRRHQRLSAGAYVRTPGATVTFQAGATGNQTFTTNTNAISFTSGYTATSGIVVGAYVNDASTLTGGVTSTFKMANASGGNVVAQTTYAALSTTGGNLATDNVLVTSSTALNGVTGADIINSLLIVGDGISISGNALTVNNGVASTLGTASFSLGNNLAATTPLLSGVNAQVVYVNSGDTLTLNAPIYTTGGLTIAGAGTLVLPNANVSTGVATVAITSGGTGYLAGGSGTAALTFSAPGAGGTTALGIATISSGVVTAVTITNPGSGYVTAPTVTVSGASTLAAALTATINADTTSYTGGTFVDGGQAANSGTLSLGTNDAIPGTSGTLTLNNGTLTSAATIFIPNAVTLNGNVANLTFAGAGSFTFNGAVTTATASAVTLTTNVTTTINGVIGGAVATTLIKQGTATLALSGANTFTGGTFIGNGIVVAQNTQAVGNAGNVIVANGTTLEVQQINAAGSLAIARALTVVGTGAAGTTGAIEMLGGGNGINTLSGAVTLIGDTTLGVDVGQLTVSGGISGAAGLTKVGLGMATVSGAGSYNGVTTISAGILQANAAPPWAPSRPAPWWPTGPPWTWGPASPANS